MSEAVGAIYIAGRGLACALGKTLTQSVAQLAASPIATHAPRGANGPTDTAFPFFAIDPPAPADHAAWTARARELVVAAAHEAGGDSIRHAPLFIASSSLNMGAVEQGQMRRHDMHAEAESMAAWLNWEGPVYWISTACTSSLNALLGASRLMREGLCDEALVLGIELANRYTQSGFAAMQLLSPTAALPLGAERNGLVLGEAVAALRLSKTPQRWALLGGASVVNGKDATGASHDAVVSCWREALHTSGLDGHEGAIDLLKLQAAGSPDSDAIELGAVNDVFPHAPALVTLKAHIGHTLGASGAAEIALLTAGLEAGIWPSVSHAHDADLPHSLTAKAPARSARVLASIIGFGGSHACVILQDSVITPDIPLPDNARSPRVWEICGRSEQELPEDWRTKLAALLGQRPRRIGIWAEAGLYGALQCMANAGEAALPTGAILRICSLEGPIGAILQTLQTIAEDGMAMPVAFLQSQPGQLPAIVAQALQWQGDARITNSRDPINLLGAACSEAGSQGVLIGWIEEPHEASDQAGAKPHVQATSLWLRLRPANPVGLLSFSAATAASMQTCRYVRISASLVESADVLG